MNRRKDIPGNQFFNIRCLKGGDNGNGGITPLHNIVDLGYMNNLLPRPEDPWYILIYFNNHIFRHFN